jgi:hypothetical protein
MQILASEGRIELKVIPGTTAAMVKLTYRGRKSLAMSEDEWQQMVSGGVPQTRISIETPPQASSLEPSIKPPKAFVSHSTQDHGFVEKFATDLRINLVDAWYSGWEIKPGDSIERSALQCTQNAEREPARVEAKELEPNGFALRIPNPSGLSY